jgi:hypothetical protein
MGIQARRLLCGENFCVFVWAAVFAVREGENEAIAFPRNLVCS